MGLKPIVLSGHKLLNVLLSKTVEKNQKVTIEPFDTESDAKEDTLDYREYRAAVRLALPFLAPAQCSKKDLLTDPLLATNNHLVQFYKDCTEVTDTLDLAYSIKIAIANPKNVVAMPKHFVNVRNKLIAICGDGDYFIDRDGNRYKIYSEIPEHIRKFLEKIFHKKIVGEKRKESAIVPTHSFFSSPEPSDEKQELVDEPRSDEDMEAEENPAAVHESVALSNKFVVKSRAKKKHKSSKGAKGAAAAASS